jgi:ferredoxin
MHVVVDMTVCVGNGLCMNVAPEVFDMQDDGSLTILQEYPAEELREKVEDAVRMCPVQAIVVEG